MDANAPHLRLDVHDRSRVEWVATVPLAPAGQEHSYEVLFEADIPDAMWVPHQPWDHFQVRSRLTSPVLNPGHRMVGLPIEQLRRRALAAAHELKLATRKPLRILQLARQRDGLLREDEATDIIQRLRSAIEKAIEAREAFDYLRDANDAALEREQALAVEYVSTQILLLITKLSDTLIPPRARRTSRSPRPPQFGTVPDQANPPTRRTLAGSTPLVQAALREALVAEQTRRQAFGLRLAWLRTAKDVEVFINRAALLKKHFQQALFLDASAYMLDQRLRNWIAAVVAMIASTFYFVWQIYLLNAAMTAEQTTVALVMAGVVAALVYAAKDRIKEVGRDWLASRLKHSYADRVVHLSLQKRMDNERTRFALARETIQVGRQWQPDLLNPGLGKTALVHHVRIRELLRHEGLKHLHDQGQTGLKHVFRYDLSPIFVKLDDHLKRVPFATPDGVRTFAALRSYTIPVTVRLTRIGSESTALVERGVLLVRRRGLVRFMRTADTREAPQPIQAWVGTSVLQPSTTVVEARAKAG